MATVQIEAVSGFIGQEGHKNPGDRFQVDEKRARYLIEKGLARLVKPAAPAETKPTGPLEKKPSGAPMTGLLTVSPSSSAPGAEAVQSSLPGVQASALTRPTRAVVRGAKSRRASAPLQ